MQSTPYHLNLSSTNISPPKIAIISDAEPARNGVGAYYQDLSEHLQSRGYQIKLFCPVHENGRRSAAMAMPLPGDTSQRLCVPNPFSMNAELAAFHPDMVILPTPGPYGLAGAFLCERLNIPVTVGFHTPFEQLAKLYWQRSLMGRMVRQYFRNSNAYLFDRCNNVVANSREMQRLARRLGAEKVDIVGTLLPMDFIDTPTTPHSGQIRNILFAGRLAAEKNIDAILRAAGNLPNLTFSIAGDGPLKHKVETAERQIPNVRYLGWLTRDQLRATIDQHDVLILPSHFESFGTIALEAMARQRPALVSRYCGIAKWSELSSGMTVIDDGTQLSDALQELAGHCSEELIEIGRSAREAAITLNDETLNHWCQLLFGRRSKAQVSVSG